MTKNGQKWPKIRVFGLIKKIKSLVLSGICVKWKFLWFILLKHSAKTACLRKIWFSSYSQKWLSANEISVFFYCQYRANRLISDFDFWHIIGMNERNKAQHVFWKNSHLGKWAILGPKICILVTLDPLEEFFFNFAQWKGLIGRWKWF